jgi:hypothetical protein
MQTFTCNRDFSKNVLKVSHYYIYNSHEMAVVTIVMVVVTIVMDVVNIVMVVTTV